MRDGSLGGSVTCTLFEALDDAEGEGLKLALVGARRNPKRTRTFPPTPIPANVVPPPPPGPSEIPNSRPSTLNTASCPLRPNTTSFPFNSCSKCRSTSVRVAVGGNVPVRRMGGSEHCNAKVIGFIAEGVSLQEPSETVNLQKR